MFSRLNLLKIGKQLILFNNCSHYNYCFVINNIIYVGIVGVQVVIVNLNARLFMLDRFIYIALILSLFPCDAKLRIQWLQSHFIHIVCRD